MKHGTRAARLRHKRVHIAWTEAYATNLQARKAELDASSLNAPRHLCHQRQT
jgi:hypothetical protein